MWVKGQYNLAKIVTVGDHSWAPLDLPGTAGKYHISILYLLDQFKRANPKLKIVGWHVEQDMGFCDGCETAYPILRGVWIDHEEKTK